MTNERLIHIIFHPNSKGKTMVMDDGPVLHEDIIGAAPQEML
jgi:hypothetical protein